MKKGISKKSNKAKHVESPKYIMICLKSPKSSEFDICF